MPSIIKRSKKEASKLKPSFFIVFLLLLILACGFSLYFFFFSASSSRSSKRGVPLGVKRWSESTSFSLSGRPLLAGCVIAGSTVDTQTTLVAFTYNGSSAADLSRSFLYSAPECDAGQSQPATQDVILASWTQGAPAGSRLCSSRAGLSALTLLSLHSLHVPSYIVHRARVSFPRLLFFSVSLSCCCFRWCYHCFDFPQQFLIACELWLYTRNRFRFWPSQFGHCSISHHLRMGRCLLDSRRVSGSASSSCHIQLWCWIWR